MSTRNLTIAFIVLALLLFGYAGWAFKSQQEPSYVPPAKQAPGHGVVGNVKTDKDPFDVEIAYTDQGFASSSVVIKQGTRVRFVNNSKESEWPASGIHPTHTLYPEKESTDCLGSSFDSCEALAPGEFFDFTFNYPGTWPFHDHLHAYNTGEILVQ